MARRRNDKQKRNGGAQTPNNKGTERKINSPQYRDSNSGERKEGDHRNDNDPNNSGVDAGEAGKKNDVAWYANFPELLAAASNFPFGYQIGGTYKLGTTAVHGSLTVDPSAACPLPGIMTLTLKNTVPGWGKQTDAINVAANAFYTHLRVVNSGRKNYDPVDSMLYLMAIADLFSLTFFYQKIYGIAKQYSQSNKYIGRVMAQDLGVDWDDLLLNLANFRYWLNTFTKKLQAYAIPSSVPYFMRRVFEYSGIYLENDKDNIKDQLYQFRPLGFYKFQLDTTKGAGMLHFEEWSTGTSTSTGSLYTVSDLITFAESLITNIWADEDFALISGDIIKAYGSSLITIDEVPADFVIPIVHNPEVLAQIHNSRVVHMPALLSNYKYVYDNVDNDMIPGDVYQSQNGQLYCYETIAGFLSTDTRALAEVWAMESTDALLNSEFNAAAPEYVVEATRLIPYFDLQDRPVLKSDNSKRLATVKACTELVVGVHVSSFAKNGSMYSGAATNVVTPFILGANDTLWSLKALCIYLTFKYAPILYYFTKDPNSDTYSEPLPVGQIEAYTILTTNEIRKLHDVCALSLFYVPGIAQFIESKMR